MSPQQPGDTIAGIVFGFLAIVGILFLFPFLVLFAVIDEPNRRRSRRK